MFSINTDAASRYYVDKALSSWQTKPHLSCWLRGLINRSALCLVQYFIPLAAPDSDIQLHLPCFLEWCACQHGLYLYQWDRFVVPINAAGGLGISRYTCYFVSDCKYLNTIILLNDSVCNIILSTRCTLESILIINIVHFLKKIQKIEIFVSS